MRRLFCSAALQFKATNVDQTGLAAVIIIIAINQMVKWPEKVVPTSQVSFFLISAGACGRRLIVRATSDGSGVVRAKQLDTATNVIVMHLLPVLVFNQQPAVALIQPEGCSPIPNGKAPGGQSH